MTGITLSGSYSISTSSGKWIPACSGIWPTPSRAARASTSCAPWPLTGEPNTGQGLRTHAQRLGDGDLGRGGGLRLVRRAGGAWRLIHSAELKPSDVPLPAALRPCTASTGSDGDYRFRAYERAYQLPHIRSRGRRPERSGDAPGFTGAFISHSGPGSSSLRFSTPVRGFPI